MRSEDELKALVGRSIASWWLTFRIAGVETGLCCFYDIPDRMSRGLVSLSSAFVKVVDLTVLRCVCGGGGPRNVYKGPLTHLVSFLVYSRARTQHRRVYPDKRTRKSEHKVDNSMYGAVLTTTIIYLISFFLL